MSKILKSMALALLVVGFSYLPAHAVSYTYTGTIERINSVDDIRPCITAIKMTSYGGYLGISRMHEQFDEMNAMALMAKAAGKMITVESYDDSDTVNYSECSGAPSWALKIKTLKIHDPE